MQKISQFFIQIAAKKNAFKFDLNLVFFFNTVLFKHGRMEEMKYLKYNNFTIRKIRISGMRTKI